MANPTQNLNANPLIVTGAMSTSLVNAYANGATVYVPAAIKNASASLGVVSSRFIVRKVVWINSVSNGDTFVITDGAGTNPSEVASGIAVTSDLGVPQTINPNKEVSDLQVTQLSSGYLLIYLDTVD